MILKLDPAEIVDLGTQIAGSGAIRGLEIESDQVFESIIAIAVLIYDMYSF